MERHVLSVTVSEYKCYNLAGVAGFIFLKNFVIGETGWQNQYPMANSGLGQLSTLIRTKLM
jgi:hypothetical protein